MIGIDSGTAGVGMFFLELYNVTKDREYLEYAEGAGRYLLNSHFKDGQVDWLNGAAGVGNSFAIYYSYDPQPDSNYLEYAKGSAHWLMSASEFPSFEQVK